MAHTHTKLNKVTGLLFYQHLMLFEVQRPGFRLTRDTNDQRENLDQIAFRQVSVFLSQIRTKKTPSRLTSV